MKLRIISEGEWLDDTSWDSHEREQDDVRAYNELERAYEQHNKISRFRGDTNPVIYCDSMSPVAQRLWSGKLVLINVVGGVTVDEVFDALFEVPDIEIMSRVEFDANYEFDCYMEDGDAIELTMTLPEAVKLLK